LGHYREQAAPVTVDLRQSVEQVLTDYQAKLRANGICVDCRFDNHRPVVANRVELVQVFSNVIANAIDAMPQVGVPQISETANSEKEGSQIVIRDSGAGIQQEHLSRKFEPFSQLKAIFARALDSGEEA
jgi:C4-dicarboxylate-specific signal transduction histidine kinase